MNEHQVVCASEQETQTPQTAGFTVRADDVDSAREMAEAIVADQPWRVVAVTEVNGDSDREEWIPERPDDDIVIDGSDFECKCWFCGYSYPENYASHAGVVGVITATSVRVWYCSKRCRQSHEDTIGCDIEVVDIGSPREESDELPETITG